MDKTMDEEAAGPSQEYVNQWPLSPDLIFLIFLEFSYMLNKATR